MCEVMSFFLEAFHLSTNPRVALRLRLVVYETKAKDFYRGYVSNTTGNLT